MSTSDEELPFRVHPACAAWPRPPLEVCIEMAGSIKFKGLSNPIWLMPDGAVIDGKTRYEACIIAKVEPRFETYTGNDPIGFTVSQNLHRRHLSTKEKAEMAVKMANMVVGGKEANSAKLHDCPPVSLEKAAEMFGISRRSVAYAKAALKGAKATKPRINKVEAAAQAIKAETGEWPSSKTLTKIARVNRRNADNALRTVKAIEDALEAPVDLRYTKAQEQHIEARIKAVTEQFKTSFDAAVAEKLAEALAHRDEADAETLRQANVLIEHSRGRTRPPFTAGEYTGVLLRALHPDTSTPEARIEAFKLVNSKKLLLRDEGRIKLRSSLASPLPKTPAEWAAAKAARQEERRQKRNEVPV